jgi:molybdopterin synthase sulfur carrier subunit
MGIKIHIPSYLQPYTNDKEVTEVTGGNVGECLNNLIKQFPNIKKMLFDKENRLHSYIGVYLNGEDIYPDILTEPVKNGAELHLLYIIGGG